MLQLLEFLTILWLKLFARKHWPDSPWFVVATVCSFCKVLAYRFSWLLKAFPSFCNFLVTQAVAQIFQNLMRFLCNSLGASYKSLYEKQSFCGPPQPVMRWCQAFVVQIAHWLLLYETGQCLAWPPTPEVTELIDFSLVQTTIYWAAALAGGLVTFSFVYILFSFYQ